MKKNNNDHQLTEAKEKYRVVRLSSESSLGYWIIPLSIVLIIGITYVVTILFLKVNSGPSLTSDKITTKDFSLDKLDLNKSRSRVGEPINLDETNWGRADPLAPAE